MRTGIEVRGPLPLMLVEVRETALGVYDRAVVGNAAGRTYMVAVAAWRTATEAETTLGLVLLGPQVGVGAEGIEPREGPHAAHVDQVVASILGQTGVRGEEFHRRRRARHLEACRPEDAPQDAQAAPPRPARNVRGRHYRLEGPLRKLKADLDRRRESGGHDDRAWAADLGRTREMQAAAVFLGHLLVKKTVLHQVGEYLLQPRHQCDRSEAVRITAFPQRFVEPLPEDRAWYQ